MNPEGEHFVFVMKRCNLPLLCENSTAKTEPSGPTISDTWDTLVPEAAPKYKTFEPGLMWILSTPDKIEAASFDLKGFQILYSIFWVTPSAPGTSEHTLFSPYTLSPTNSSPKDFQSKSPIRYRAVKQRKPEVWDCPKAPKIVTPLFPGKQTSNFAWVQSVVLSVFEQNIPCCGLPNYLLPQPSVLTATYYLLQSSLSIGLQ